MDDAELVLDGNSLAGLLGEVFAGDVTMAVGGCGACGAVAEFGAAPVYSHAPGAVIRCGACGEVLLVVVHDADRYRLGFDRLRSIEIRAGKTVPDAP